VVDLIFTNGLAANKISKWQTFNPPLSSDHKIITFVINKLVKNNEENLIQTVFPKWPYKSLNVDLLQFTCRPYDWSSDLLTGDNLNGQVDNLCKILKKSCDISMSRNAKFNKKANY
jgi:hypothetical protein